jgi:uncharacterized protein (TIGR04255 family)
MPPNSKYQNPAIIEAIIDIRVEARREPSLKELERIWGKVKDRYGQKKPRISGQFEFGLGEVAGVPKASASSAAQQIGFDFKSSGEWLFQVTTGGCTFNQLGNYTGWDRFFAEAQELWPKYAKEVKVKRFTRLAVRYINRFDILAARVELKDYFRTGPEVSPDLPQDLAGFFMQTLLPLPQYESQVIINQTIAPPAKPGCTSVVLDLDLACTENLGETEEQMWAVFGRLREAKNNVFEACITDRIRELIR